MALAENTQSPVESRPACGFIGLGSQGAPIARRMVESGYPMRLWARRKEALEPFARLGATFADDVADLARQVDYLGICVFDDDGVRQVCAEAIPAMQPGALLVIHSTIHPDTSEAMEAAAASRGIDLIDAPVSGGQPAVEAGTLTIMAGGSAEAFARARPIFECFGGLILHLGKAGAGQQAKLINNSLLAANMAMAQAAIDVGKRMGIEGAALTGLINASSGQSYGCGILEKLPALSAFAHGARLLVKDTGLLGELTEQDRDAALIIDAARPFLDRVVKGD